MTKSDGASTTPGASPNNAAADLLPELSIAEAKQADLMLRPIDFVMGVVNMTNLPPADMAEVAFAGRSNVGKSSLINALVQRKTLARASNTPGRTRELNYFKNDDLGYLVDLPGYGYAVASKDSIAQWTKLTRRYLVGRQTLRRVFVLIDARHGVKDSDKELMNGLSTAAVSFQVFLTKADKIKAAELAKVHGKTLDAIKKMPASHPEVIPTSSEKKTGLIHARLAVTKAMLGQ